MLENPEWFLEKSTYFAEGTAGSIKRVLMCKELLLEVLKNYRLFISTRKSDVHLILSPFSWSPTRFTTGQINKSGPLDKNLL